MAFHVYVHLPKEGELKAIGSRGLGLDSEPYYTLKLDYVDGTITIFDLNPQMAYAIHEAIERLIELMSTDINLGEIEIGSAGELSTEEVTPDVR